MMDDFAAKAELQTITERFATVRRLRNEASEHKRRLLDEVAQTGLLLLSREDVIRLILQTNEIPDFCEDVAFRLHHITKKKIGVDDEIREDLRNLAQNALKTVTGLREAILTLSYRRIKPTALGKRVEATESAVDEPYREVEMKILDSKKGLETTLLVRDIVQLLNDISDKADDATDSVRILAIGL